MLQNRGEQLAIAFGKDQIRYGNLFAKLELYAGLCEMGKGERAVVFSENRPGWFYAFYAIWKQAGIPVPIDFMATASEVAYILKDAAPAVVFVSENKRPLMEEAIAEAAVLTQVVVIDPHETLQDGEVSSESFPSADPQSTAVIIYTSGTTGSPKGVMLSYQNLLANINGISNVIPIYTPQSRVMVLLPLHHVFPLMGSLIIPLQVGGSVAISPSMTSEDIIRTLNENKITIIIGVPRLYAAIRKGIVDKINKKALTRGLFALARKINSQKFSRLLFGTVHRKFGGAVTHLVSGGAALDPEVGGDFKTLGFEVLEGYGMTETAPMITFTRPGRVRIGSPGELMPGVQVKIVDGEITASGDNVMNGYYNKPEETAEVLKDGWLYTGDLGHIDEDGYLYITGRKKEIIVTSNGKNINPIELEEQLSHYAAIVEAGVFFNDDQIQAVLVVNQDITSETYSHIQQSVVENFNNEVSSYKKIMKFYLTQEELPRTQLGKLQRYKLYDFIPEDAVVAENESENAEYSEEFKIIANFLKKEKSRIVTLKSHLELDLGLDSLDKVALHSFIHQSFGIPIDAGQLNELNEVGKLVVYVEKEKTKIEEAKIDWNAILQEKTNFKLPNFWLSNSFLMRVSKFFFKIYLRFGSKGEENIPEGPCIIAPNHQSFFDALFVTTLMRTKQIRNTFFYAKAQHVEKPFVKFIANNNNIIVVDLNKNLKESIQKLAEVLKQKKKLLIF